MRGMPLGSEAVEDQRVETLEQGPRRIRNAVRIGAVGEVPEPEAEHVEHAVLEPQRRDAGSEQVEGRGGDPLERDLRHAAAGHRHRLERVVEGPPDPPLDAVLAIHGHRAARAIADRADVIEAVDVVDVVVRVENCLHAADLFAEQLPPEIGRGVDEERAFRQAEDHARAGAVVPRVGARAGGAGAADDRHAHARARAEKHELPSEAANRPCVVRLNGHGGPS